MSNVKIEEYRKLLEKVSRIRSQQGEVTSLIEQTLAAGAIGTSTSMKYHCSDLEDTEDSYLEQMDKVWYSMSEEEIEVIKNLLSKERENDNES